MTTTKCGFNDAAGVLGRDALVAYGPTLIVQIGFDPTYDPAKSTIPNLPTDHHHALVDTGATISCIDIGLRYSSVRTASESRSPIRKLSAKYS